MFSVRQKREISDAVQKILRDTGHPELPQGEIRFSLHVDGAEAWSWADIRNNGAVLAPGRNAHNEMQDKGVGVEYELKRGQALIISGPQGCGKTTLARKIAAQCGTVAEIDVHSLESPFCFGNITALEPDTLIIEGFPIDAKTLSEIKMAITNDTLTCHQIYKEPRIVKSPNFIFCCGEEEPLHLDAKEGGFLVVRLVNNGLGRSED